MRHRRLVFIAVVQSILWAAHALVYATAVEFLGLSDSRTRGLLGIALGLLSVSFVPASILAFRTSHGAARAGYGLSAVWLGILSFLFFACLLCWGVDGAGRLLGAHLDRRAIALAGAALALAMSLAALVNAHWIRLRHVRLELPRLPESWKGRVAALVSDIHLGPLRNRGYLGRLAERLARLRPDILFIPGDLYDGTAVDAGPLARILGDLPVPRGIFYVTGNHEEFSDPARFIDPLRRAGIRVLQDEKVEVDGLQIVGLQDATHRDTLRLREVLSGLKLDPSRPSVLLAHAPVHLGLAERQGFALQVSGHTHGGQFIPFTWIVSWIYGRFASGLARWGNLWVLTSSGAGTWGPPMRLGTRPEIVVVQFE